MTFTVLFSPADEGGYVVRVPALPEVVTEGDTLKEARANAREAIACALLARRDLEQPWPGELAAPSVRPPVRAMRLRATLAVA